MKTRIRNLFRLPTLIAGLGLIAPGRTMGQTFTTLYHFTSVFSSNACPCPNSDGAGPIAGLILSENTLYGTALGGGSWGYGTVFRVNTGGAGFTNLHSFNGSDGSGPQTDLVLSGNTG